ncbi:MAG: extracellular solute-binding protein [Propionibacteriaceae bacterium]|nr:extracellular solute-binding protein [Propionibacteriaceae bacterium]
MAGHFHSLAIALTGAALVLTACTAAPTTPPASPEPGGSPTAIEPTTINFFTDKAAWEPSFDQMNAASESTGLTLSFTGYSDPTAFDAFIKQAFQTKKVPDLFTWHTGDSLKQLVDQGLVAETTQLWADATAQGLVPDGLIDNYTYDGKQYCVPLNVAYWAMYYNKHVFAEHGIAVPTTWDELMAASQKLVDAGVAPFHQMNFIFEFVWFQTLVLGIDPQVYRGLGTGESSFLDPAVVQAMELWKEMGTKGFFIDPGVQTDPQTLLSTGQVAMANFGTFFTGQLTGIDAVSGEDYGIFVIPSVNPQVKNQMVLETGPLCVGAGAEHEQAALAYSGWWFTDAAQSVWSESRGAVSFNPTVAVKDPALAALVAAAHAPDVELQPRFLEMVPNAVYTTEAEVIGDFVTNWGDPMEALKKLQAAADEHWSSQ